MSRFLHSRGQVVVEVNRPDRQARRRRGKSDPLDAEAAARAVQAQQGSVPKAGDGQGLVVTAPAELREQLQDLPTVRLV